VILFSPLFQFLFTKKLKQYFFYLRVLSVYVLLCVFVLFFSCFVIYVWGVFQKWGKFSSRELYSSDRQG